MADVVLVPVLPTGLDVDRLATTLELLADLEAALENFNYAIVLNRFDARKGMAHEANDALNAHPRLKTVIKSLSAYEKVFGQIPTRAGPVPAHLGRDQQRRGRVAVTKNRFQKPKQKPGGSLGSLLSRSLQLSGAALPAETGEPGQQMTAAQRPGRQSAPAPALFRSGFA